MKWEEQARIAYANDTEDKRHKAIAAGRAMDNALELEYSKGGHTHSHFMTSNWLKYFSPEALGKERILLLWLPKKTP
jgi:hypothetical protein